MIFKLSANDTDPNIAESTNGQDLFIGDDMLPLTRW